jgi:Putative threonine/serine exporter
MMQCLTTSHLSGASLTYRVYCKGQPNISCQLYPRKAFIYNPAAGTTSMFRTERGFNMSKMSAMEGVVVRLASFASSVHGPSNIPARFPNPEELHRATTTSAMNLISDRRKVARKILSLASRQQGLFYYLNSREYMGGDKPTLDNSTNPRLSRKKNHGVEDFWMVTNEERELFSRLACQEALKAIGVIDARANDPDTKSLYSPCVILSCRAIAAAGSCAFWFGGSWPDMMVAGALAIFVDFIGTSSLLTKQERLVYEVVASFLVGLISGLLALTWPESLCFSSMGKSTCSVD